MSLGGKPTVIPNYLSASTLNGLRRLFLLNNLKHGTQFKYFDIQKQGNQWFAFYFNDVENELIIEAAKKEGVE